MAKSRVKFKMKSGIYTITNIINGKFYVGSSSNCPSRWHKKYNKHLESAFKKYGKENFLFEIIEEVEPIKEKLLEREQYWIDKLKPYEYEIGYNFRLIAESNLGAKQTEETKKLWSSQRKGRKLTEEWKENIRQSLLGREITWGDKISMSNSGENHPQYGKELAEEHKQKISETLQGRTKSQEHCKAISEGKKGKTFSEEHKKKLSEAAKRRKRKV